MRARVCVYVCVRASVCAFVRACARACACACADMYEKERGRREKEGERRGRREKEGGGREREKAEGGGGGVREKDRQTFSYYSRCGYLKSRPTDRQTDTDRDSVAVHM